MPKRPPADKPDAFVFVDAEDGPHYLCALCDIPTAYACDTLASATVAALDHLRWKHSLRRSFVERTDPRHAAMVQLAIPFVVALNTTRHGSDDAS